MFRTVSFDSVRLWNLRSDIEIAFTQKDQVGKVINISEATGPILDLTDHPIDSLSYGVSRSATNITEYAFFVPPHSFHKFLQGLQTAS